MADDEEVKQRKEREPISVVCLVVLVVACVAVAGSYVSDTVFGDDDDTPLASGKTVEVNYTGSFYGYYYDGGSIFQTTVSGIANDSSYIHSAGYTAPGSYTTIEVELGAGEYLPGFENALIGHKVGDKVEVKIDAADGYSVASCTQEAGFTLYAKSNYTMSAETFKALYDETAVVGTTFDTGFGWKAMVAAVNNGNVTVTALADDNGEYDVYEGDYGKVTAKVTGITSGVISFTLTFADTEEADSACYSDFVEGYSAIKMIELNLPGCYTDSTCTTALTSLADGTVSVIGTSDSGFIYRTVDETKNIDLYFVIEIVALK